MKFAIDIRGLSEQPAGKQRVVLRLLKALIQLDHLNTYLLLSDQSVKLPFSLPKNFKRRVDRGWGPLWHSRTAQFLEDERVDAYLSGLSYLVSALSHVPSVLIVHDLVSFTHPETSTLKIRFLEKISFSRALAHSGAIGCVSEATKQKLFAHFGSEMSKLAKTPLAIIHNAADEQFVPVTSQVLFHSVRSRYHLPERFILFVGTLEPRKNIPALLEAYWLLPKNLRNKYKVVIAGKKGWKYKDIFSAIRHLDLGQYVQYIDYVSDGELPALYSLATVFVLPSLSEGFGLPVLEAMSCGTPVIASDVDSLSEVVGKAGLLFDPHNPRQLKDKLEQLLTDSKLRSRLARLGQRRAKDFSWETSGKKVWELLKQAGQASRNRVR